MPSRGRLVRKHREEGLDAFTDEDKQQLYELYEALPIRPLKRIIDELEKE